MDAWFWMVPAWVGAYLVGAIPFGYLVARARGVDIFAQGSGNIGATNVGRVLGRRFGILVFCLDFAKGAMPVFLALRCKPFLGESSWGQQGFLEVGTALAVFLGHLFPLYLRFRGGKGVATGFGAVLVLVPGPTLAAAFTWVMVLLTTRYVSLASVAGALVLVGMQLAWSQPALDWINPRSGFCLLAATLVVVRHRGNLVRLLAGKESHFKESKTLDLLGKIVHILALGMWFGTCIFFTFVVTLSLFHTFEGLGQQPPQDRPAWFPLPDNFSRIDEDVNGPREQGSRAAGQAVGPLFHWYYLVQGLCGLIALVTAMPWPRIFPGRSHRLRVNFLYLAMALVLVGWPLDRKVSELRVPRNQAMDAYLKNANAATLEAMGTAKAEFTRWHTYSLLANFGVIVLVTGAMALAAQLPEFSKSDAKKEVN